MYVVYYDHRSALPKRLSRQHRASPCLRSMHITTNLSKNSVRVTENQKNTSKHNENKQSCHTHAPRYNNTILRKQIKLSPIQTFSEHQYDTARLAGKNDLKLLGRLTPEVVPAETRLSIPSNVSSSVFMVSSSSCGSAGVAVVVIVAVVMPYVKLWVRLNFTFLPKIRISRAQAALCRSSCIAT